MKMLRGETFIFIEFPKHADVERIKEAFERWMEFISLTMPTLYRNLQEHLEIDCEGKNLTHDGDFDDLTAEEQASIAKTLKMFAQN